MRDPTLYVPIHVGIWDHPKTRRLMRSLEVDDAKAVGTLVALWTWALHYAPDGDLSDLDDDEIAEAARYRDDPTRLVHALRTCGWMDDDRRLNDWGLYAGEGLDQRSRARERKRAERDRKRGVSQPVTAQLSTSVTASHSESQDSRVTVTEASHTLSRNVTPERERIGNGSGTRTDREGSPEPVTPALAVDRSRQNPNAPPALEGAIIKAPRIGMGGVGFMENPADFPETADELVERHRADLTKSFPMLDGRAPRPTLLEAVQGKWASYVAARARVGGGHANAYAALKTWLGELSQKHRISWEREHATTVDNSAAVAATRKVLKQVEGPHPSDLVDEQGRAEIAAMMATVRDKATAAPKHSKVLPPARASPGGGDHGSGKPATSTG